MRRVSLALLVVGLLVAGTAAATTSGLPGTKTKADRAAWRAILHWPASCEKTWVAAGSGAGVYVSKTPTPKFLVQVQCFLGAYQGVFMLYLVGSDRTKTGPLVFNTYIDPGSGVPKATHETAILGGFVFDSKTGSFNVLDEFRGLGDCGIYTTGKLSGDKLVTTEVRAKTACNGKPPFDPKRWPKLPLP